MDLDRFTIDGTDYETEVPRDRFRPFPGLSDPRDVKAFIPGTVVDVRVKEGEKVSPGQVLLLLDAMKMHNEVCAGLQGRVRQVLVSRGDRVEKSQLLLILEEG
jgi:biotin carboxyl carrier protein